VFRSVFGFVFPVYWAIASSFVPETRLFAVPPIVPSELTLDHYRALFDQRQFWLPMRNSLIVSCRDDCARDLRRDAGGLRLDAAHIQRSDTSPRGRARGVDAAAGIAGAAALLALRATHLIDTYAGLVLPYLSFALPLSIWLLVGYFRQLPPGGRGRRARGPVRAGCRPCGTSFCLPLAWPGVATAAILTFLYCWNEFIFALSFTLGPARQTAPVAIALFRGRYQVPWGQILAAAVVTTLPVVAVVVAFERRIVEGLTAGAMKG